MDNTVPHPSPATSLERLGPVVTAAARVRDPAGATFERLARLAAGSCAAGIAAIIDTCGTDLRVLGAVGAGRHLADLVDLGQVERADRTVLVSDLTLDTRHAGHRSVTGEPSRRFLAGLPLVDAGGLIVGRLLVADPAPRDVTAGQLEQLGLVADEVVSQRSLRRERAALAAAVTVSRAAEAESRRTERLLRGVLSSPDIMVHVKDLAGLYLLANHAAHAILDLPDGAIVGKRAADVLPPGSSELYLVSDREVAETGVPQVTLQQLPHRDGTVHQLRVRKFPLRDEAGQIYAIAGISFDVTDQLAAEAALRESEHRWRQLFAESPVGIGLADEGAILVEANEALCQIFGRPLAEVVGHRVREFSHPDDADPPFARLMAESPAGVAAVERRYLRPDGEVRSAWLTMATTPGPAGTTWGLGYVQDVTERVRHEEAIKDSEANLTAVAEVIKLIQGGGDARQTIVNAGREFAASAYAALLEPTRDGRSLEVTATTDETLRRVVVPLDGSVAASSAFLTGEPLFIADPVPTNAAFRNLMATIGPRSIYLVPVKSKGVVTAMLSLGWMQRTTGLDERRARIISLLADQAGVALRQVELVTELETLALTDPLTGLPNRRSWDNTMSELLIRMGEAQRPLSVALVDLDHFKIFNDTYGHAAGDEFLREFAGHARRVIRSADTVARWGGEEFAVALPNCREGVAAEVLERIRMAVPGAQTCSVGYGTWNHRESAADLMARIDEALYEAKRTGRDRIVYSGG